MTAIGNRLKITSGPHTGRMGTVTKIHGPKTVEMRMDAGFMLWRVKLANTEDASVVSDQAGKGCPHA